MYYIHAKPGKDDDHENGTIIVSIKRYIMWGSSVGQDCIALIARKI